MYRHYRNKVLYHLSIYLSSFSHLLLVSRTNLVGSLLLHCCCPQRFPPGLSPFSYAFAPAPRFFFEGQRTRPESKAVEKQLPDQVCHQNSIGAEWSVAPDFPAVPLHIHFRIIFLYLLSASFSSSDSLTFVTNDAL